MKRLLITITLFLLGIGCGFGAFFMLKTGTEIKQEELEKAELVDLEDIRIEKGSALPDEIYHIHGNENVTKAEVDVTSVNTSVAGIYPIKYTYYDKKKKKYSTSIQCIVYENDRKKATDKKEVMQDNSTQEYIPPKTGEEHELFILSFLLGISVVSIGVCGYTLGKNRKGADRI